MKIITWNCNMAFRKKAHLLLALDPDILIIPECEHPDKLKTDCDFHPNDKLWYGNNTNKGLGIFSFKKFRLTPSRKLNDQIRLIIPIRASDGQFDFTLFAVWAYNPDDPDGCYVEQVWKGIHQYARKIRRTRTLLVGDFNSNTIWDKKYRTGNHSHVVEKLGRKGISSCYHLHHQQEQGKELHSTFYLYKHKDKPYHLDYCFASKDLTDRIESVEIGEHSSWIRYSDHVPLTVQFKV